MADRQWVAEGVQVYETGEEEWQAEGVQLAENQPDAAAATSSNLLTLGVGS